MKSKDGSLFPFPLDLKHSFNLKYFLINLYISSSIMSFKLVLRMLETFSLLCLNEDFLLFPMV